MSVVPAASLPESKARRTPSTVVNPSPRRRSGRRGRLLMLVAEHSVAIGLSVAFMAPIGFLLLTSFMNVDQTLSADLWPGTWHPENYIEVFRQTPMLHYLLNTVVYASLATVFMLLASVPAAYALSKLRWRARTTIFIAVICVMMLPPQVVAVPLYLMWANASLTGSLWPLILPMLAGTHSPSSCCGSSW